MNISAGIPGVKPWHLFYAEFNDWSAVTEPDLGVASEVQSRRWDQQDPKNVKNPRYGKWVQYRHNARANVGFLDTHVDMMPPEKLVVSNTDKYAGSLWHPQRPPNWQPTTFTH